MKMLFRMLWRGQACASRDSLRYSMKASLRVWEDLLRCRGDVALVGGGEVEVCARSKLHVSVREPVETVERMHQKEILCM